MSRGYRAERRGIMADGQNQPKQYPGQPAAESSESPAASGLTGLAILAGGIALLAFPPLTLLLAVFYLLWTIAPFAVFPWALWQGLNDPGDVGGALDDVPEEYDDELDDDEWELNDDEVDRLVQRGLRDVR